MVSEKISKWFFFCRTRPKNCITMAKRKWPTIHVHYTDIENYKNVHRKATENRGWTRVFQNGKQFLLHRWHLSCCSYYKNPVTSQEREKEDMIATTTKETYMQQQNFRGDNSNLTTSNHWFSSVLTGNTYMNHKFWNIYMYSYQLRGICIYSKCMTCWNVATHQYRKFTM